MPKSIYSYDYSRAYQPAMPVVDIEITLPGQSQAKRIVTALVDSGSDASMIPLTILIELKARYVGQGRVQTVLGDSQLVNLYLINLHVGGHLLQAVQVIGASNIDEVILGRDVLNQLTVTLNGLANITEINT